MHRVEPSGLAITHSFVPQARTVRSSNHEVTVLPSVIDMDLRSDCGHGHAVFLDLCLPSHKASTGLLLETADCTVWSLDTLKSVCFPLLFLL